MSRRAYATAKGLRAAWMGIVGLLVLGLIPALPQRVDSVTSAQQPLPPPPDSAEINDPYPALPEGPGPLDVIVLPPSVSPDPNTDESARLLGHAQQELISHASLFAPSLTVSFPASIAGALAALPVGASDARLASYSGRVSAAAVQVRATIRKVDDTLILGGWWRVDPRWLPAHQREAWADRLTASSGRLEPVTIDASEASAQATYDAMWSAATQLIDAARTVRAGLDAPAESESAESTDEQPQTRPAGDTEAWQPRRPFADPAALMSYVRGQIALRAGHIDTAGEIVSELYQLAPGNPIVALLEEQWYTRYLQANLGSDTADLEVYRRAFAILARSFENPAAPLPQFAVARQMVAVTQATQFQVGLPFAEVERVLLVLVSNAPHNLGLWSQLLGFKLGQVYERYGERAQVGLRRILETAQSLADATSGNLEAARLNVILNANVGNRAAAAELLETLPFDPAWADPTGEEPLPASYLSVRLLEELRLMIGFDQVGERERFDRLDAFYDHYPELLGQSFTGRAIDMFTLASNRLFGILDQQQANGDMGRDGRLTPNELPSREGFGSADRNDDGELNSFEANGYYAIFGDGPLAAHTEEPMGTDAMADRMWSAALCWWMLGSRQPGFDYPQARFLDNPIAKERLAMWQTQARSALLTLDASASRGDRAALALQVIATIHLRLRNERPDLAEGQPIRMYMLDHEMRAAIEDATAVLREVGMAHTNAYRTGGRGWRLPIESLPDWD